MSDEGLDDDFDMNDSDSEFEDFDSGSSLSDVIRDNPLAKIGMVLVGFITIIGGIVLFGGGDEEALNSTTNRGSDMSETPGSEEVSNVYRQALEESNLEAVEEAIRTGTSSLPVPISPPVGRISLPEDGGDSEDPLERWRRIQAERQKRQVGEEVVLETADPNADAVDALAEAMAAQMESVLDTVKPKQAQYMSVAGDDFLEKEREEALNKAEEALKKKEDAAGNDVAIVDIILPAGTIEYAQLITEANSDAKGPILAQLVSGPLAGSRMLGTFETKDDFLVLNFETVVIEGVSHSTEAVALDPKTANTGVVTDIDRRYFTRVILPAAAAFVEGLGSAIADAGSTSVTSGGGGEAIESENDLDTTQEIYKGVAEAASKVSELLDDEASSTQPLLRVEAGTPLGILFVQPVTEQ